MRVLEHLQDLFNRWIEIGEPDLALLPGKALHESSETNTIFLYEV